MLRQGSLLAGLAICAALLIPRQASALKTFTIPQAPNNGVTAVGIGVINNKVYMNVSNSSICWWFIVSERAWLEDDVEIHGSSGKDFIYVYDSPGTVYTCSGWYTFGGVDQNWFGLHVFGHGGTDSLTGTWVEGGPGNDWLMVRQGINNGEIFGGGHGFGDDGDDEVRTTDMSLLFGGNGNDKLCAAPTVYFTGFGDGGSNVWCGAQSSVSGAVKNCTACGF